MFGRGAEEVTGARSRRHRLPHRARHHRRPRGLAYAGIPATHRDTNQAVIFLTGHDETGGMPAAVDWAAVAKAAPVIVMYMAVKHLARHRRKAARRRPRSRRPPGHRHATPRCPTSASSRQRSARSPASRTTTADPGHRRSRAASAAFREDFDWYAGKLREQRRLANGLVIAAPRSGSGKTVVTLGLLAALGARLASRRPRPGPTISMPKILGRAAGATAVNLDPWAMSPDRLRALAADHATGADLLLVEGVMGLFDGAADGTAPPPISPQLLDLPVILVVDADRQSQSDRAAGATASPLGGRRPRRRASSSTASPPPPRAHAARCLGRHRHSLPRRHPPHATASSCPSATSAWCCPTRSPASTPFVDEAAEAVGEYVDLDQLLGPRHAARRRRDDGPPQPCAPLGQRIAIARDDAFAFLYPHWLDDWRAAGRRAAASSRRSPTRPRRRCRRGLPARRLSRTAWRHAGRRRAFGRAAAAAARGALIYGECGGFMVLGETLIDKSGVSPRHGRPLAGHHPHRPAQAHPRLPPAGAPARCPGRHVSTGHEFHYSTATPSRAAPLFAATDALGEPLPPMGAVIGRVMGSYAHVIDAAKAMTAKSH